MILLGISQTARIDGHRLGPPKDDPSTDKTQKWKNNASDGIDMSERVQGHPTQMAAGGIPKPIRCPGMGRFVNTQGK